MRRYFIETLDHMQEKFEIHENYNKRERQILLDIIKMEQRQSRMQQINRIEDVKATHLINSSQNFQIPKQEDSSLSIGIDTIDENVEIFNYEINIKNKAVEDLHK